MPPPVYFPPKREVFYGNFIINDVICAKFLTALFEKMGSKKL